MDLNQVRIIALIIGIGIGLIMNVGAVYVFVKKMKLELSGIVMTGFGSILLGLSVFSTVQMNISYNGIDLKLENIQNHVDQQNGKLDTIKQSVTDLNKNPAILALQDQITAQNQQLDNIKKNVTLSSAILVGNVNATSADTALELQNRLDLLEEIQPELQVQ